MGLPIQNTPELGQDPQVFSEIRPSLQEDLSSSVHTRKARGWLYIQTSTSAEFRVRFLSGSLLPCAASFKGSLLGSGSIPVCIRATSSPSPQKRGPHFWLLLSTPLFASPWKLSTTLLSTLGIHAPGGLLLMVVLLLFCLVF